MGKSKVNVLMCGSDLSVKGGMVTVVKNYLEYSKWDEFQINYLPTHIEKGKLSELFYFSKAYVKILYLMIIGKIDIAYLHTSERGSVYRKIIIAKTMKLFGIPVVLHHHGAEFERFYSSLSATKKRIVNNALENVDVNIVLSKLLVNMITSKAPEASVFTLYNSVPVRENQYNKNGDKILFLGRLGERKGTYDLIKAICLLDNKIDSKYKFILCGDGDVEKVNEIIKRNHISHRIEYIGWADQAKKNEFFKDVIINVLPSYNEGLPMTILETMAYGIPNISTRIASIPEVIDDEKNGYLITPGDINGLTERIQRLIEDEELRIKFSDCAYKTIKSEFSMDSNIHKLKDLLRTLINEGK